MYFCVSRDDTIINYYVTQNYQLSLILSCISYIKMLRKLIRLYFKVVYVNKDVRDIPLILF